MKRDLNGGIQKRVEVATFGYLGENGPYVHCNAQISKS